MFTKVYNFLKSYPLTPSVKQRTSVFFSKDLRQYRVEHIEILNAMIGKNWPLNNLKLDMNKTLKNFFLSVFMVFIFFSLFLIFLWKFFFL